MNDLLKLLHQHTGGKAITITVPFDDSSFAHKANEGRVKTMIKNAENELSKMGESDKQLSQNMKNVLQQIDFSKPRAGIGIFVSSKLSEIVHYDVPVKERLMISEIFDTHDLLYNTLQVLHYYVLLLSDNHTRLFKATGRHFTEIKDKNFPMHYTEEHQYNPTPSPHLDMGEEVSSMEEVREFQYLRLVDEKLGSYLTIEKLPFVLMGTVKRIGYFKHATKHLTDIAGEVKGNFDYTDLNKIETTALNEMTAYQRMHSEKDLLALKETVGTHLCVYGLNDVYKAASEGRGLILFVEKDFSAPGELSNGSFNLFEQEEGTILYKTGVDVVTAVIEEVIRKHGKVHFVENNELEKYGRIALILRY